MIGPVYVGEISPASLAYWDGLAAALEQGGVDGFVDYIDRNQGIDPAWRDSVLRFTRERMLLHRHLEALVEALREVPRSRPFESLDGARGARGPGPGRRQPRRRRSRPSLRGRRGLRRAAAASAAGQRGGGGVAAGLAGRAALAGDRRLLRRGIIFITMKFPTEATAAPDDRLRGGARDRRRDLHHDRRLGRRRADLPGRRRRLRDGRQQLLLAHRRGQHRRSSGSSATSPCC